MQRRYFFRIANCSTPSLPPSIINIHLMVLEMFAQGSGTMGWRMVDAGQKSEY